jgi:hypothetical protein
MGSDHNIVYCVFNYKPLFKLFFEKPISYIKTDWHQMSILLRNQSWDTFFLSMCPCEAASIFSECLLHCLITLTPTDNSPMKYLQKIKNNSKIDKKLQKLRCLWKKTNDISIIINIFNLLDLQAKNNQLSIINKEKLALSLPNKAAGILKLKRQRNSSLKNEITFITLLDNSSITDTLAICKAFNSYFSTSFTSEDTSEPIILCSQCDSTISNIKIDIDCIKSAMSVIIPTFYPGPDGIPPAALKRCGNDIPLFLLKMFNLSLDSGVFPDIWKMSIIIPRHKSGPKHLISNYRPINHTSIISRTLERIVQSQLCSYLLSNNLISSSQHGFLRKRSCATSHFEFLDFVTRSADMGNAMVIILLDIQKAFD